jgi:hypothetical protein
MSPARDPLDHENNWTTLDLCLQIICLAGIAFLVLLAVVTLLDTSMGMSLEERMPYAAFDALGAVLAFLYITRGGDKE